MNTGKMDKRIQLQSPNVVPDGKGGLKPAEDTGKWGEKIPVWAEFKTPSFKDLAALGTMVSEINQLIVIRRRNDVERGWRVLYGNKIFNVLDAYSPDRESTILICNGVSK